MHMRTTLSVAGLLLVSGCASSKPAKSLTPRDPALDAYIADIRADLSEGKVGVINEVMRLTPAEAAAFWPIYSDYEQELFALGDRRLKLIEQFMNAHASGTLNDGTADTLASAWLKLQLDSHTLMEAYYKDIANDVSPLRAAQFLQIEHRTNTVIDLLIASEMPLVTRPPPDPAGAGR